jgi:chromosome partitioning protein
MKKQEKKSSQKNPKVICFSNHKGGVSKTCSAVNIGAGLSKLGKQCLLVDLDPQANLSISLGIKDPLHTVYGSLTGEHELAKAVFKINESFHVVPSHLDLSGAEIELSSEAGREVILKELIDQIKQDYDFILLDCPPSLGLLTINALTASDEVYIPLQAQFLAFQGLAKLIEVIEKIRRRLNKKLKVGGVLITQYDSRKVLNRDVAETIEGHFKDVLFKTKIRDNIALAEAPSTGMDIFRYNPKSNGASDYLSICREIVERNK